MILINDLDISSIFSCAIEELEKNGFVHVKCTQMKNLTDIDLEHRMLAALVCFGSKIAKTVAYKLLTGNGSQLTLQKHTECIYVQDRIPKFFSIGCLKASEAGGETRIFDARKAAILISQVDPCLLSSRIEYKSRSYPESKGVHQISIDGVVRFRENCETNTILEKPNDYRDEEVYGIVSKCIEESIISSIEWESGDILVVNNEITLHDRTPYKGLRKMLRVRYDDPLNVYMRY